MSNSCNMVVGIYSSTVNTLNCRHFGTQASVLYLESALYSGFRIISYLICAVITVAMLLSLGVHVQQGI